MGIFLLWIYLLLAILFIALSKKASPRRKKSNRVDHTAPISYTPMTTESETDEVSSPIQKATMPHYPTRLERATNSQPSVKYHYKSKAFVMTKPENDFFDTLTEVVGSNFYVFPQMHLSSILDHTTVGQSWKGAFSTINQKSVDYVICSKAYRQPLLAIELDDSSHDTEDREQRDANVAHMLAEAHIPLIRFRNVRSLSKEEISQRVHEKLPGAFRVTDERQSLTAVQHFF